jgi:hypothetical protein
LKTVDSTTFWISCTAVHFLLYWQTWRQPGLSTALIYKHFNTVGEAKLLLLLRIAFLPYRMGRGENCTKPLPY